MRLNEHAVDFLEEVLYYLEMRMTLPDWFILNWLNTFIPSSGLPGMLGKTEIATSFSTKSPNCNFATLVIHVDVDPFAVVEIPVAKQPVIPKASAFSFPMLNIPAPVST